MKRRALLAAAAAATTTGIAGCLDDQTGAGPESSPTDEPTESPTPSPTETPEETYLAEESFEVTRVECGNDHGGHDVTTEDGVVTVEGTLDGSNGCYTAELVVAEYDAEADELSVEVESVEDRDDGESCTTCVVEIDYVAEFTFENGEPSKVSVQQRGISGGSASSSGSASESESGSGESTPPTDTDD